MEITEIKDLLNKMNALAEDTESIDSVALMQDPIVLNRLAVELLQQVDRDSKPELVIAPEGIESYFGYSVALAAWMRFLCAHKAEDGSFSLPQGTEEERESHPRSRRVFRGSGQGFGFPCRGRRSQGRCRSGLERVGQPCRSRLCVP